MAWVLRRRKRETERREEGRKGGKSERDRMKGAGEKEEKREVEQKEEGGKKNKNTKNKTTKQEGLGSKSKGSEPSLGGTSVK